MSINGFFDYSTYVRGSRSCCGLWETRNSRAGSERRDEHGAARSRANDPTRAIPLGKAGCRWRQVLKTARFWRVAERVSWPPRRVRSSSCRCRQSPRAERSTRDRRSESIHRNRYAEPAPLRHATKLGWFTREISRASKRRPWLFPRRAADDLVWNGFRHSCMASVEQLA